MRAGRAPLSAAAAVSVSLLAITAITAITTATAAAAAATAGSDVEFLQAMRREEGNIDRLIFDILNLQGAKGDQQQQRDPSVAQFPDQRWYRQSGGPSGHPARHFAYYPSDPEYRLPRRDGETTATGSNTQGTDSSDQRIAGEQKTEGLVPISSSFQDGAEAETARPDQEEMPPDDVRDKRPMTIVNLAGKTAELHGPHPDRDKTSDAYFIVAIVGICTGTVCISILGGVCYRYLQRRRRRSSSESGYPSYGVTGPHSALGAAGAADRKLAQSAQLYHYQHHKQHMMAIQEGKALGRCSSPSDENSDGENDESEHTVYECPGLAPSGEMEVKNPLFSEDPTPCQSSKDNDDQ